MHCSGLLCLHPCILHACMDMCVEVYTVTFLSSYAYTAYMNGSQIHHRMLIFSKRCLTFLFDTKIFSCSKRNRVQC